MDDSTPIPDWRKYERFIAALQLEAVSDDVTVIPNARLHGCISGVRRQVDVLIDARLGDDVSRRVIVEARRTRRKIDVTDVEAFKGAMEDCRASHGILVCASGHTAAAYRRAQDFITLSIVRLDELDGLDLFSWQPCLGQCSEPGSRRRREGWVLYEQPFGVSIRGGPLSIISTAKCDECHDFHIWCWDCGQRFALRGDESEGKCSCERFFLTSIEDDGVDEQGHQLNGVYLLMVPLDPPTAIVMDRRPLH
jgi:Restriction endonuclease